jgi:hypothetical protein
MMSGMSALPVRPQENDAYSVKIWLSQSVQVVCMSRHIRHILDASGSMVSSDSSHSFTSSPSTTNAAAGGAHDGAQSLRSDVKVQTSYLNTHMSINPHIRAYTDKLLAQGARGITVRILVRVCVSLSLSRLSISVCPLLFFLTSHSLLSPPPLLSYPIFSLSLSLLLSYRLILYYVVLHQTQMLHMDHSELPLLPIDKVPN